jgi:hypothetical protein
MTLSPARTFSLNVAFLASLAAAAWTAPAPAATVSLSRFSRSVTDEEVLGGALPGGIVHDFFVSSGSDLLSVNRVNIDVPLFQHELGSDSAAPLGPLLATAPALSADSFIALPGSTLVLGGGFGGGAENTWGDLSNDGPQENFHFARLTVNETGRFAGQLSLRGYDNVVHLPFDFVLPGRSSDLGLLDAEPLYTLDYSLDPPPYVPPATPIAWPPPGAPGSPTGPPPTNPDPTGTGGLGRIEVTRRTHEIPYYIPGVDGTQYRFVHEFFVSSTADILSVGDVDVNVPLFQDALGSDNEAPSEELLALSPTMAADSWITTPGDTVVLGDGFASTNGETLWGDLSDDGPQRNFMFARLTVDQTGIFSGNIAVRGPNGAVELPFELWVPGTHQHQGLINGGPNPSMTFSLDPLAPPPTPDAPPPGYNPPVGPPWAWPGDPIPIDPPNTDPPPEPGPRPGIDVGYPILVELPDDFDDPANSMFWRFPVELLPSAIDLSLIDFVIFDGAGLEGSLAIQAFRSGGAIGATVYYASADAETVHDFDGLEAVAAAAIARFAPPDNLVPEPAGGLLAMVATLGLGGLGFRRLSTNCLPLRG